MSDKEVVHRHEVKDSFVSPRRAKKLKLLTEFLSKQESRNTFKLVSKALKKSEFERTQEEGALLEKNRDVVKRIRKNKERKLISEQRVLETEDSEDLLQTKCGQLAAAIKRSRNAVIYTGAGISTAASIPDYRGPQGVWTLLQRGEQLQAQDLSDAEPTVTHMCIAQLHKLGKVKHIVSQNCDGLHLRSGLARQCLSEVHGNMFIEYCYKCRPQREYVRLFDVTENTGVRKHYTGRHCHKCGGKLHDTIVHFGEKGGIKAPYRWKEAARAANKCDLILCLGSSLKILRRYPCLWCMDRIKSKRPKLFVVNLQWTPKDGLAMLKINGRCDDVITRVMKILGYEVPVYTRDTDQIFKLAVPMTIEEMETTSKKVLKPPVNVDSNQPAGEEDERDVQDNSPVNTNMSCASQNNICSKRKEENMSCTKILSNSVEHGSDKLTKEEVSFLKSQQICNAAKQAMHKKSVKDRPVVLDHQANHPSCEKREMKTDPDPISERSKSVKTDDELDKQAVHPPNGIKHEKGELDLPHNSSRDTLDAGYVYQQQQLLKLSSLQCQLAELKQCREELRTQNSSVLDGKVKRELSTSTPAIQISTTHKPTQACVNGHLGSQILKTFVQKVSTQDAHPSMANIERDELLMNEIANSQSDVQKQMFTEWAESRVQNMDKSLSCIVPEIAIPDHRNGFGVVNFKETTVQNASYCLLHEQMTKGSDNLDTVTCPSCTFLRDYGITKRRCMSCDELNATHRAQQMYLLNSTYTHNREQRMEEQKFSPPVTGCSNNQANYDKSVVIKHSESHVNRSLSTSVTAANWPAKSGLVLNSSATDTDTIQQGYTGCATSIPNTKHTLSLPTTHGTRELLDTNLVNSVLYDHFYLKPHDMRKLSPDNRAIHTQPVSHTTMSTASQHSHVQHSTSVTVPNTLLTSGCFHNRREAIPGGAASISSSNTHLTQCLPSISSFMSNSLTKNSVIINTPQEHNLLKLSLKRETLSEPVPTLKHGKPSSPKKNHSPDKWFIRSSGMNPPDYREAVKTELKFGNISGHHRSMSISEDELSKVESVHTPPVHRSYSQGEIDNVATSPVLDIVIESGTDNSPADEEQGSKPEKKRKLASQLSVPGWFGKGLKVKKLRKYKY